MNSDIIEEFLPDMVEATGMSENEIKDLFKQADVAAMTLNMKLALINKPICASLLKTFQITKDVNFKDIKNLKEHTSQSHSLGAVLAFDFKGKHYYAVDDYSLDDRPEEVEEILQDINHLLKGKLLKNPIPQSDGAQYAAGLNGVEYYLWESPSL
jgi:hypothetical protein